MNKEFVQAMMLGSLNNLEYVSVNNPPDQWDWCVGVGVLGAARAHIASNNDAYVNFLKEWIKRNSVDLNLVSVNNVIPATAALYLWTLTKNEEYFLLAEKCADWCLYDAKRTVNGGLAHVWTGGDEDFKNQLWIDTVYMAVIFLVYFGKVTNQPKYICEGLSQLSIHIGALIDPLSGLFYHGYHCNKKENIGSFWSRGNGWMAATLADCIYFLQGEYNTSYYERLLENLCNTVYNKQDKNQPLHTLLHRSDSYNEMTGTMLFGYAAARGCRCGISEKKYADWAKAIAELVKDNFIDEKYVDLCSAGTDPASEEIYCTRKIVSSPFADGITLSFLSEMCVSGLISD